jgi:Domain of unknown function (DUF4132)/Family of unknown function (DUF5724)
MLGDLPEEYAAAIAAERTALWELAGRARTLADKDDKPALRALAEEVRRRIASGNAIERTGGHLRGRVVDILTAFDGVYDEVFAVRDPRDPADVLDAPWPTQRRAALLTSLVTPDGYRFPSRDPLVAPASAAGDARLLRLLVTSPVGRLSRDETVRALDALQALGALDTAVIEYALLDDLYLGNGVLEHPPFGDRKAIWAPAACAAAVQDVFDDLLWRLTDSDEPATRLPEVLVPRGLRFVLRALAWPPGHPAAARLGAATLTPEERVDLLDNLSGQSQAEQERAFRLRLPAGDAQVLLPLLGLAGCEPLLALIQGMPDGLGAVRQDRAAILAAAEQAGPAGTRRLLELCPSELVAAALGLNRAAVLKRVKSNALQGIAACGLLPLAGGETALDRYLALREVAKRGAKLGPNRKLSHAAAVSVALDHLAQVAGYPDASRLEWDCEARLAEATPLDARVGDYTAALRIDGAEPVITVAKAGKPLKSVPAAVRADPAYAGLRQHQELLRDQARRMRTGLIEPLVAAGGQLEPGELARLLTLPAGAAMLPALVWEDQAGTVGLLDEVELGGAVTVVHPFALYERGLLARWQEELVRRRIKQPVKQVFRELYLLTPAERERGDTSRSFAGHVVNGKVAAQLLAGRGWAVHGEYDDHQATRPAGPGLTAALRCDLHGYFGLGDVTIGDVRFLADGVPLPLDSVPEVTFSEVMRDLDLVVSVAGTATAEYGSPAAANSRGQLLAALIEDLGLDRVSVEGTAAVVRGSRATYRVHLTSGSIHLEPAGYLCIVPATFGAAAHRRLFLPFADEDRLTSVILSKVLLLNDDESITDPTILAQLPPAQA